MTTKQLISTAILTAATFAVSAPAAVMADPPAVGAPTIPGAFINSPTTQGPNGGEFTANFADNGRFESFGRVDQHYQAFDLTTARSRRQASARQKLNAKAEQSGVNGVFTSFTNQLRSIDESDSR